MNEKDTEVQSLGHPMIWFRLKTFWSQVRRVFQGLALLLEIYGMQMLLDTAGNTSPKYAKQK